MPRYCYEDTLMSERKVNRRGLFGNLLRGVADEVARTPVGAKEVTPKDAPGGHVSAVSYTHLTLPTTPYV